MGDFQHCSWLWQYVCLSSGTVIGNSNTEGYLPFKFRIGGKDGLSTTRSYKDANWILYRMADVLLMKAEALIWKGGEANFAQALELINKIRTRANVTTLSVQTNAVSQENMLGYLLQERDLEFAAEGKRWYDLYASAGHRTLNIKISLSI